MVYAPSPRPRPGDPLTALNINGLSTHTGAVVKRREIKSTTNKQTTAGSGEQNPSASLVKR